MIHPVGFRANRMISEFTGFHPIHAKLQDDLHFQSGSEEKAKTTRNVAIEMAMDLCIDEKDEERESEAQSVVRAKKRARGRGRARASSPSRLTAPRSLALHLSHRCKGP